jgi:hypothetical protein
MLSLACGAGTSAIQLQHCWHWCSEPLLKASMRNHNDCASRMMPASCAIEAGVTIAHRGLECG